MDEPNDPNTTVIGALQILGGLVTLCGCSIVFQCLMI